MDKRITEQVSNFNYLSSDVIYVKDMDIYRRVNKLQAICDIISKTLKTKVRRGIKLRFYKINAGAAAW